MLVAVVIVVLLGFAAIALDVGNLYRVRGQLQNASDAAALAGVQRLDRTAEGIDQARDMVKQWALEHMANGETVAVLDEDILFGHWDEADDAFTPLGADPDDPAAVNAIQVTSRRAAAQGNAVDMSFAPFLGSDEEDVSATAVAISGGPSGECGFPMVVPDCSLDEPVASGDCDYCMVFQDNNTDNAGWTSFDQGSVSGPTITELVESACTDGDGNVAIDPETGQCAGACTLVDSGEEIKVQNGNLMNQGGGNFCPLIQDILTRGIEGGDPEPFIVRVPVLESTDGTCDASQFSSFKTIAGFATLEILGAKCANPDPGVFVPGSPCEPPSSGKYIVAALRCDQESDTSAAGGGYFGLHAKHVRLVR